MARFLRGSVALAAALVAVAVAPSAAADASVEAGETRANAPTCDLSADENETACDADLGDLQRRLEQIVIGSRVAGAAAAVVDARGVLWVGGFGRTGAVAGARPVDADTLFRVGSISKSFLALAAMRLVEQGRMRLEDRVRDLVPEAAAENPWEATAPLHVAHLLEHTSGFDEMRFNEIEPRDGREDHALREILAVNPRSRRARWPPGTRFSYSQPGYTTAGYVLEKVSGMPYERLVDELVFRPMGIHGPAFSLDPQVDARLSRGHAAGRETSYRPLLHRPAAGLMISARGIARLLTMLINRGELDGARFLSAQSIERIERSGTLSFGPVAASYGLGNWGDVEGPLPMRGHGGWLPGYQGFFRYSPTYRFGYVVLVNDSSTFFVVQRMSAAILRHLLRGITLPLPPREPRPPEELAQFIGHYRMASPPIEFLRFHSDVYDGAEIAPRASSGALDGGLELRRRGRPALQLIPTGRGLFRTLRESDSSIELRRNPEGRLLLSLRGRLYEQESATWAALRRWALELALAVLASVTLLPAFIGWWVPGRGAGLLVCPLVAGLALLGTWLTFGAARDSGALGALNPMTASIWILSWIFAVAAHLGIHRAVRSLRSPVDVGLRIYALVVSLAALGLALYLSVYEIVGVRTWRW